MSVPCCRELGSLFHEFGVFGAVEIVDGDFCVHCGLLDYDGVDDDVSTVAALELGAVVEEWPSADDFG